MMFGSGVASLSVADNFQSIRLINNDTAGGWIAVWDCTIDMDPTASYSHNTTNIFLAYGKDSGINALEPAFPVSPTFPLQPGLVKLVLNDPVLDTYPYQCLAHPGFWQWNHDWPLFYIQPGQYFGVLFGTVLTAGTANVSAAFYWETGVKGL